MGSLVGGFIWDSQAILFYKKIHFVPGVFRDSFGSYSICIVFINLVSFTTLVLWSAELYYMKKKNSKRIEIEPPQIDMEEVKKMNIIVNVS